VTGANNIRLHFSAFDVHAGSSRTAADYVQLQGGSTVVGNYTGAMGAFWAPWAGVGNNALTASLVSDNSTQTNAGFTIDKLEYTSSTNGQFVMYLRMPGQIWDDDVQTIYNNYRWYRREDGRYLSPDPTGLAGGEAGFSAFVNSNPLTRSDPKGQSQAGNEPCTFCDSGDIWCALQNLLCLFTQAATQQESTCIFGQHFQDPSSYVFSCNDAVEAGKQDSFCGSPGSTNCRLSQDDPSTLFGVLPVGPLPPLMLGVDIVVRGGVTCHDAVGEFQDQAPFRAGSSPPAFAQTCTLGAHFAGETPDACARLSPCWAQFYQTYLDSGCQSDPSCQ
jgi:RHS repeat-associated protein